MASPSPQGVIVRRVGAPTVLEGGKRVHVYLDAISLLRAAELGGGNVSEGIRVAINSPK